jgi:hypothetical protein
MAQRSGLAMRSILVLALFLAGAATAQPPARLDGWAVLPAATIIAAPADAGPDLAAAGKFTGADGPRLRAPRLTLNGAAQLPLSGQAVQGVSALRAAGAGTFWALSDNGFGAKANSADAMLMLHRLKIDWESHTVTRLQTIFLTDPNVIAPFRIAKEGAGVRYLTGADFDPESLVVRSDGGLVIGEEFGPWLLGFDAQGRLEWAAPAVIEGVAVESPDNPRLAPADVGQTSPATIGRSKGFEGLSASADGKTLYAMLEGPVRRAGAIEAGLRILAFDLATRRWTGQSWLYPLDDPKNAIGEIVMIGARRALVIERDGGQGDVSNVCPPQPATLPGAPDADMKGCHDRPALFKKVFAVDLPVGGGAAIKQGSFDLLAIADPKRLARSTSATDQFSFPFQTIEAIEPLADGRLLIANDNNYPFSDGRLPDTADATEFILLTPPPGFLKP